MGTFFFGTVNELPHGIIDFAAHIETESPKLLFDLIDAKGKLTIDKLVLISRKMSLKFAKKIV
jgi:hypothetical protein